MIRSKAVHLARQVVRQPTLHSAALGLLRAFAQPMSTVFMLHRFVDPKGPEARADGAGLSDALATLRRQKVEFLPLGELVERMRERRPARRPSVTFTVDDGYLDFGEVAAPVFREFDCPVTVFLSTDVISSRNWYWWDRLEYAVLRSPRRSLPVSVSGREHAFSLSDVAERLQSLESLTELVKFAPDEERKFITAHIGSLADVELPAQPPEEYRTLDWNQVRELEKQGVSFGPHSCSHPIFSRIDDDTARREIVDSWAAIRRECRRPEPIFCFPNGTSSSFSSRDMRLVDEAGLRGAVSYIRNRISTRNSEPRDAFCIPRFEMPGDSFGAAWLTAAVFART